MSSTPTESPSRTRIATATFIGTAIEFYDFYIYGTAAALVFGTVFFPAFSPVAGTLASLATFAVGFVARPFGAILFGHFGDRVGRKRMLIISLLLMGVATVAVGLIPSYAAIGVLAPILLVVARFVQGIGLGGEWGGARSCWPPSTRRAASVACTPPFRRWGRRLGSSSATPCS